MAQFSFLFFLAQIFGHLRRRRRIVPRGFPLTPSGLNSRFPLPLMTRVLLRTEIEAISTLFWSLYCPSVKNTGLHVNGMMPPSTGNNLLRERAMSE